MPSLDTLFPRADLARAIQDGHVSAVAHPELPLTVYAYTRLCQYTAAWTPVTIRCRGLVVDDTDNQIGAWPFEKFFNAAEHVLDRPYAPPLPDEPFRIYDKVDGSLGIVFHYAGKWRAATRGAFISDEARWAQRWLDSHDTTALVPSIAYLAELVFPQNRVVVHYGDRQDMVLLGAYDRNSARPTARTPTSTLAPRTTLRSAGTARATRAARPGTPWCPSSVLRPPSSPCCLPSSPSPPVCDADASASASKPAARTSLPAVGTTWKHATTRSATPTETSR